MVVQSIYKDEEKHMEKEKFVALMKEAEATLFHVAFSILHHEQDSADAVSEAVVKAYEGKDTLRNPAYFKTWMVRIVINECYGILRKNRRQFPIAEQLFREGSSVEEDCYINAEYLDLYRAIQKLREKDKICIVLFYMEGFTIPQIAEILSIPTGTVKSRLNRARKQLKDWLA